MYDAADVICFDGEADGMHSIMNRMLLKVD